MLTVLYLLLMTAAACSTCPSACVCDLDGRGRRMTKCNNGSINYPIPIDEISPHVRVLEIVPPPSLPNNFTIGPIFQKFLLLEEVTIVWSNIPAIGRHTFWGVPSLSHLNLTHNRISTLIESNFRGMDNLRRLHLDYNRIDSMHSGVFSYLVNLEVLTLSHNRISVLSPRVFLKLTKLIYLDMGFNPLEELDIEIFKDIQDLRDFRCRCCAISNINGQLYVILQRLSYFDIGDNDLKYIDRDDFFALKNLQVLHLDGNLFPVVLEKNFAMQKQLKLLNLSKNRIAKVTNTAFANMSTLIHLDLSYNKLDKLDPAVFQPIALTLATLKLSGNYLKILDMKVVLQVIPFLKSLALADMYYTDIPIGVFSHNEQLRFLNLSGNQLQHIPGLTLSPLKKLAELDISHNRFKGLEEKTAAKLAMVSKVHYNENPWYCDTCHIVSVITRMNISKPMEQIQCTYPARLNGTSIGQLKLNNLEWCSESTFSIIETGFTGGVKLSKQSKYGLAAAIVSVIILIIVISVTIACVVSNRYYAYYYTQEDKRDDIKNVVVGKKVRFAEHPKKISIATIDEITRDPDLRSSVGL